MTLKHLRLTEGHSQRQLAKLIGVSITCVSKWESGKMKPNDENIEKLSIVYNMSIEELIRTLQM